MSLVPTNAQLHRMSWIQGEGWEKFSHPTGYELRDGRLLLGCGERAWEMMIKLIPTLGEPVTLVYSVQGHADAPRFEQVCSAAKVMAFFEQFREFLICDGRHEVTVSNSQASITWDEHDMIVIEGMADAVLRLLPPHFLQTEFELPFPHQHHVHECFDADLAAVLKFFAMP